MYFFYLLGAFEIDFNPLSRLFWFLGFLKFFKDFSSVFWEFIRESWFISRNYCFLSDFFGSFWLIEDLFWFSKSFLWILKLLWIFWGLMDLFWLYGMFFISFGFLCFFLVLSMLSRLISIVYKVYLRFSSIFWEFIRSSWFISRNYCVLSDFFGLVGSLQICFDFL